MRDKQIATFLDSSVAFVTGMVLCNPPRKSNASLSEVLETEFVPSKYFLSAKACLGILRRAEKRGKDLPAMLGEALRRVVDSKEPRITNL